ncbi:MAG: hypothetical protein LBH62_07855 [Nitrososphaerota archaeon]|nr:hypothetical protein [Nitrososphaerota archaeon]
MFDFVITIENIMITGSFSENLDLKATNQKLAGSRYSWKKFPRLSFKLKPLATFLMFQSGKFVCTGIKTEAKGKEAITKLLELLKTEKIVSENCKFEYCVKNLVASINIGGASVSIEQFITEFDAAYEPEKFPAAIHKLDDTQATFLIFLTGKLVCSGVSTKEELKEVVKKFYSQLKEKNVIQQNLIIN